MENSEENIDVEIGVKNPWLVVKQLTGLLISRRKKSQIKWNFQKQICRKIN